MLIKKSSLLKIFGKKETKGKFRADEIRLSSVPGQNDQSTSQKKYTEGIRNYFQRRKKKKNTQGNYNIPSQGKKQQVKRAGLGFSFLVLIILGVFVATGKFVVHFKALSFFSVSQVVSSGNMLVSDEKLREVSGIIPFQTNLLSIDSSAVEEKIKSIPWIASANVSRNWPTIVEISVVENVPVALLHNPLSEKSQLHYVDKNGQPFLPAHPGSDVDFPVITGLMEIGDQQLRKTALNEVMIFLKTIGRNRNHPYLPAQSISEIHLNEQGQMVVYLTEYPFPIFFGDGDTKKKYSKLIHVLKALYVKQKGKESISNIEYIQMDYLNNQVRIAESGSG